MHQVGVGTRHKTEGGARRTRKEMGVSKGKMTKIKKLTRVVTGASTQPEKVQWVEASTNKDAALDGTMQEVRVSESERRKTTEKKNARINAWGAKERERRTGVALKKSVSKANNVNKRKTYLL